MRWGIAATVIPKTLRTWSARVGDVTCQIYGHDRGIARLALPFFGRTPLRALSPTITHAKSR